MMKTQIQLIFRTYTPIQTVSKSFFHRLAHYPGFLQRPRINLGNIYASQSAPNFILFRSYAAQSEKVKTSRSNQNNKSLTESSSDQSAVTLSLGEKVKENAKTGGYGLVILAGLAVTGGLLWVILSELFSSESPNNIYTHSFKLCKLSPEVQDALGSPIKCHGEETRRGWRRHVSHVEFYQGNTKYLRMKFYVEGPFKKGTVHLEKKQNDRGKYEYTYLIVEVDGYPPRRIDVHF